MTEEIQTEVLTCVVVSVRDPASVVLSVGGESFVLSRKAIEAGRLSVVEAHDEVSRARSRERERELAEESPARIAERNEVVKQLQEQGVTDPEVVEEHLIHHGFLPPRRAVAGEAMQETYEASAKLRGGGNIGWASATRQPEVPPQA